MNKNIQMQNFNGESWDNLFPLSLVKNIYDQQGTSLDTHLNVLNGFNANSIVPTFTSGKLTKVEEKNGNIIVMTTTLTYNTDNSIRTVEEIFNGQKVTYTLNYGADGNISNVSRKIEEV